MSNELPEPWGTLLSGKGVHSYGDLATALGVSKSTAHRLVTGRTSAGTVQAAADKFFAGDADLIWRMRGSTIRQYGPWVPPEDAMLLSPKQRQAIEAVIAAMVPEEAGAPASLTPPNELMMAGLSRMAAEHNRADDEELLDKAGRKDPTGRFKPSDIRDQD